MKTTIFIIIISFFISCNNNNKSELIYCIEEHKNEFDKLKSIDFSSYKYIECNKNVFLISYNDTANIKLDKTY